MGAKTRPITTTAAAECAALVAFAQRLCGAGGVREAGGLCRLMLREQPELAAAQAALGRALFEGGKLDQAEALLTRAADQTPSNFAVHRWLAEVLKPSS